jgi:hypothetical protein
MVGASARISAAVVWVADMVVDVVPGEEAMYFM